MACEQDIIKNLSQKDLLVETLGECKFDTPLHLPPKYISAGRTKILFNNEIENGNKLDAKLLYFESAGPYTKLFFNPTEINVGIVTCGGLCPGINDVIRSITYSCLDGHGVKNVFGFKNGFEGLTSKYNTEVISLTGTDVDNIHELGGTILGSSRGSQSIEDMVDTLVKFNISILFVIGGDGTQKGSRSISAEIKKRKLKISIIGIPKTIDNDISFVYKTFGFDTAISEARRAINAAHVEAKGGRNGIGLVKLMGRHSGFIAAHATLASGNVNICIIPEEKLNMNHLFEKIKYRFEQNKNHLVIVVAEGSGQELLASKNKKGETKLDKSGNQILNDIGPYLKEQIGSYLKKEGIDHSIKYIDPSYMIRSTPANAADSSFCLRLATHAVHAGMAGKTNLIVGLWNQHFCLVPIDMALLKRKTVDIDDSMWRSVSEITISRPKKI